MLELEKSIVALAEKKPRSALLLVLLIGLGIAGSVITFLYRSTMQATLKENEQLKEQVQYLQKDKKQTEAEYREEIRVLNKEYAKKVEDIYLTVNKELKDRADKVENVTTNSRKTIVEAKHTVNSQGKIIKKLKQINE